MSNTPPLFGDLGKSARDLFDKNFGASTFGSFLFNPDDVFCSCSLITRFSKVQAVLEDQNRVRRCTLYSTPRITSVYPYLSITQTRSLRPMDHTTSTRAGRKVHSRQS